MGHANKNRNRNRQQENVEQNQPPEEFPSFTADISSVETSTHKEKHLFIVDWQVDNETD